MANSNFDLEYLSQGKKPFIILAFLVLLMSLIPAISLQPLDRDESRFMQATTQMFESGDYIRINFQDEARNKKPVGIHWLQAAVVKSLGQENSHNPFYFRIVSLLGAYLAAISTFLLGKTLFDRKTAFLGAVFLSTSLLLATEAHIAKTDAALTGFIALSFFALGKLRFEGKNLFYNLLFWGAFAITFLIKGPVPLMVIFLMILLLYFWERNLDFIKNIFDIRGILLFLIIALPWYIMIAYKTHGQFYVEALGKDLGEKVSGKQENPSMPPGLHTLISPILLWPWSLFMGAGLYAAIKEFKNEKIKFLLAIIIPTWLVFEISTGKLAHYTMPVHFAIMLLMAYAITNGYFKNWAKWLGLGLFAFALILVSAIPIYLASTYQKPLLPISYTLSAIIFSFAILGTFYQFKGKQSVFLAFVFVAIMFSIGAKGFLLSWVHDLNVSRNVASRLDSLGLNPRKFDVPNIVGAGYQEPSLIFLTRSDDRLASIDDAAKYAVNGAPFVVEDKEWKAFNQKMNEMGLIAIEKTEPVTGTNYSKGKKVIIHIGILTKAIG